jgi:fibro-slime domain-containing protein
LVLRKVVLGSFAIGSLVVAIGCGGGGSDKSSFDGSAGGSSSDDGSGGGGSGGSGGDGGGGGNTGMDAHVMFSGNDGGLAGMDAYTLDCDANPTFCMTPVCGDGILEAGESCDDGNKTNGDGCSSTCQIEAAYWACTVNQPCVDERDCAELLEAGVSDAGNCASSASVPVCGNGIIEAGEACDDGNTKSGDGCSYDCHTIEANYVCPVPDQACVSTVVCGDGVISGTEQCDDGNQVTTDGCSYPGCQLTPGWSCLVPGTACTAAMCGDGIVAGTEQCDDGNMTNGDGCSATCQLEVATTVVLASVTTKPSTTLTHYQCSYPTPPLVPLREVCTATMCGNGIVEGDEQCDDGNNAAYDGCSPNCTLETSCPNGTCVPTCGDGLLFDYLGADGKPVEQCDDGNTTSGDGCSSTCTIEVGYSCTTVTADYPLTQDVPVVIRDFKYWVNTDPTAHPDFERYSGSGATGMVQPTLTNGVPVYLASKGFLTSPLDFTDWYQDIDIPIQSLAGGLYTTDQNYSPATDGGVEAGTDAGMDAGIDAGMDASLDAGKLDAGDAAHDAGKDSGDSGSVIVNLERRSKRIDNIQIQLNRMGTSGNYSYVFDSSADDPYKTLGGWFPIDGLGWGTQSDGHNFSFTTELRYQFTYDASVSPTLTFSGDDDVWVFVNNQLALDLGGLHSIETSSFQLTPTVAASLGLVDQHVYEAVLFNAERHTTGSNFSLTLTGFLKKTSVCGPVCGDGIKTPNEQCDQGTANVSTATSPLPYNSCTTACLLGPHCGDDLVTSPPEDCDNGTNLTPWVEHPTATTCGPGCKAPAYCGDDIVQSLYGEQCDQGVANTDDPSAYNNCTTSCVPGPRCGDGVVAPSYEQCDNGYNVTAYVTHLTSTSCGPGCKTPKYCGDGIVDVPNEQCDNGMADTDDGAYNSCTTSCELGPHCGDGIVQSPEEQCDNGTGMAGNGCAANCLFIGAK